MTRAEAVAAAQCFAAKPEEEWLVADALRRILERPPVLLPDFRGEKRGALTVICWSHSRRKENGDVVNYWLCRCVCGLYELRRNGALRKNKAHDHCDQCNRMDHVRYLGRRKG